MFMNISGHFKDRYTLFGKALYLKTTESIEVRLTLTHFTVRRDLKFRHRADDFIKFCTKHNIPVTLNELHQ